eukprot:scaffold4236_cov133-Skeletonema_menzelii.AAC.5
MKEQQQKLNAVFQAMDDKNELTYPMTSTSSAAASASASPAETFWGKFESTFLTNEYNATAPALPMPTSPPTEFVTSHVPTHNSTTKPSASPSMLSSYVAPLELVRPHLPTHNSTTKPSAGHSLLPSVDLPSRKTSLSPSSSAHNDLMATTHLSNKRKQPTSSSLESDLAFSSGNSEGDLLNVNDSSEPNAGLGIGMGLLIITPLAMLVVGIIFEIKRRQRRRKKVILPLRNSHIPKDRVTKRKRQDAASHWESFYPLTPIWVQGTRGTRTAPTTGVAAKDTAKVTPKAVATRSSKRAISAKGTDAVKETKEVTADVAPFQSIRPQIITSSPTKCTTSASGAEETNEDVSCIEICRNLKREICTKNASAIQETKDLAGDGAQIDASAPITSNESIGADIETKKAATHVATASSGEREISVNDVRVERETKDASTDVASTTFDEVSASSSISTHTSGSVESMTGLIIKRSPKNLSVKKSTESTDSADMQQDCVTRQIETIAESTQKQTVRDKSEGDVAEFNDLVAGDDRISSRSKNEIGAKGANAKTTNEATTADTNTLPDEVSVKRSSSTQSSESIQSMTSYVIKSTKSLIETKDSKNDSVDAPTDETRAENSTNSSRIVKMDGAATSFSEMLSNLQLFFDCNGDIFNGSSLRIPS